MANDVFAAGLGEIRVASTAGSGTALTTTAGFIGLPDNISHLFLTPRNFAGCQTVKFARNPYLIVLKTADAMATVPTDYSVTAQDADSTTELDFDSWGTGGDTDFLLVGSHLPFRGVYVDVDGSHPNGTTNTLTVYYWNGTTWADASATDGTASGGASVAQDGLVYWTVASAWVKGKLTTIYSSTPSWSVANAEFYWTKWVWSADNDSDTLVQAMYAANRSTTYGELLEGQPFEERIKKGIGGIGCVEALTNAGTANLIVNVASDRDGGIL